MNELRKLRDLLDEWERADDLANEAAATLSRPAGLHAGELDRLRALQRDAAHKLAAVRKAVAEEGHDEPAASATGRGHPTQVRWVLTRTSSFTRSG